MKKIVFLVFLVSLGAATLRADDQVAAVQQELKDQGFYYGQVDGQGGPETTAAIRRYQIRNGLQVDGALNKQTLDSLKIAGNPQKLPPQPAPLDNDNEPAQPQQAQQTPAPQQSVTQNDRDFLRKQNGAAETAPAPAPTPAPAPPVANTDTADTVIHAGPPQPPEPAEQPQAPPLDVQFIALFAHTPYQTAPFEVQQNTLRNAQAELARETYYNAEVDGVPGPATARAILAFQANGGLPQTGRLDLQTLSALRLLPHQEAYPVQAYPVQRRVIIQPFFPPPRYQGPPRVYRGWVD